MGFSCPNVIRLPCRRSLLRWPKGFDRSASRVMSVMDSLDQLAYRLIACMEIANGDGLPWDDETFL